MMEFVQIGLSLVLLIASVAAYAYVVTWAVNDARDRGWVGGGVLALFWLLGPVAVPAWFLIRPNRKLIDVPTNEFTSDEEAMAAASMLDSRGEWEAALAIYESASLRWPEHAPYIERCVAEIRQRQAMSEPNA